MGRKGMMGKIGSLLIVAGTVFCRSEEASVGNVATDIKNICITSCFMV